MIRFYRLLILTCLMMPLLCVPQISYAAPPTLDDACGSGSWGYITMKISGCLISAVQTATFSLADAISDYMSPILAILLTIAIAVFGIRLLGGQVPSWGKGAGFLLRVGLVLFFFYNFSWYISQVFWIESALINITTASLSGFGGSPWFWIDWFVLQRLIGFADPSIPPGSFAYNDMSHGVLGIIGAAAMSSTVGMMLFLVGMSAVINLLLLIFRLLFTYVLAYAAIGFLLVISGLIIPLALFFYTERFFVKWLDTLFATMLVPILLNVVMMMFLFTMAPSNVGNIGGAGGMGILVESVENIFYSICQWDCWYAPPKQTDFSSFWRSDQPQFSWMLPTDPNLSARLQQKTGVGGVGTNNVNVGTPPVQTYINPMARRAHDLGSVTTFGVDFGPNNISIMQGIVLAFIQLWIAISFMKILVNQVPHLADNIANAKSGISVKQTDIEHNVKQGWDKIQNALTGGRQAA